MPSPPSTRPSGSRERRSSGFIREDSGIAHWRRRLIKQPARPLLASSRRVHATSWSGDQLKPARHSGSRRATEVCLEGIPNAVALRREVRGFHRIDESLAVGPSLNVAIRMMSPGVKPASNRSQSRNPWSGRRPAICLTTFEVLGHEMLPGAPHKRGKIVLRV